MVHLVALLVVSLVVPLVVHLEVCLEVCLVIYFSDTLRARSPFPLCVPNIGILRLPAPVVVWED